MILGTHLVFEDADVAQIKQIPQGTGGGQHSAAHQWKL